MNFPKVIQATIARKILQNYVTVHYQIKGILKKLKRELIFKEMLIY